MDILKALLFGIIEGITEWMPISSTAHMKILNYFLKLNVAPEFYEVFEVVIQLGAIAALLLLFWKKVWPFGESNHPLGDGVLMYIKKDKFILWLKIVVACLPAIIYELLIEDHVNFITAENEMTIIAIALIVVGIIFVAVEAFIKGKKPIVTSTRQISFMAALIIGLAQLIAAIIPGVSRSGATIIAALLLGISRRTATECTFELAIPVMFGASLMKILKYGLAFKFAEIMILLVGCISAFFVSLFMVKFMLNYIRKNTFTIFGIYRILMGIIVLMFMR